MKWRFTADALIFIALILCNFHSKCLEVNAEDGEIVNTATVSSENVSSQVQEEKIDIDSSVNSDSDLKPSIVEAEQMKDSLNNFQNQLVPDVLSQNSGIPNDIGSTGQILVTLTDPATAELEERADIPSVVASQNQTPLENIQQNVSQQKAEEIKIKEIVEDEVTLSQTDKLEMEVPNVAKNESDDKNEEIPSFSEWAQKRLEEAEKKEQVNTSTPGPAANNGKQGSGAKFRWKNYASLDCGAKVIASNPEAVSAGAILSPSRDEYKLNACTNRIWFVVELCEAIQAKKIDLANYELFSSSPKDFVVYVSDRFPTREWSNVGQFTAKDERDIQSFDLDHQIFGKYIKIEVKSHYGSEHYCPISLFRVYGTSVFEVLQKEDPAHENRPDDDDDDDETLDVENGDSPKNLLSSATDAVISMVKKAAEVLGNKGSNATNHTMQSKPNSSIVYTPLINTCSSPSHLVVCNNCSDSLFGQIFEILSCRHLEIRKILAIPYIFKVLKHSEICNAFGFSFYDKNANVSENVCPDCVTSFFSKKIIGAACNTLAVMENKVVLNVSQQYSNLTQNEPDSIDKVVDIKVVQSRIPKPDSIQINFTQDKTDEVQPTEPLVIEKTENAIKSSCSTDTEYVSQINPTKSFDSEFEGNLSTESPEVVESTIVDSQLQGSEEKDKITESTENVEIVEIDQSEIEAGESVEDDHLEISDFNETAQSVGNPSTTASTPQAQKESVFLRLSNRIKALEKNMSLSSQYLEELSKRYKKQVEEMQKLLEKTVLALQEESVKKDERNRELEERLDHLAKAVESLIAERNNWTSSIFLLFFIVILGLWMWLFYRRPHEPSPSPKEVIEIHRRKSIDVVSHNPAPKKRRRPSDQALKIVRSSIAVSDAHRNCLRERKKKKKANRIKRSISITTLSEERNPSYPESSKELNGVKDNSDWIEGEARHIESVPYFLDESEHSQVELLTTKINHPSYINTAVKARSDRISSQKSKPFEDSIQKMSDLNECIVSAVSTVNGNGHPPSISSSTEENTPKKEKKSFKKLFKKVF